MLAVPLVLDDARFQLRDEISNVIVTELEQFIRRLVQESFSVLSPLGRICPPLRKIWQILSPGHTGQIVGCSLHEIRVLNRYTFCHAYHDLLFAWSID